MNTTIDSKSHKRGLLAAALLLVVSGCSGTQSSEQALQNSLANAGASKESIYPLAGNVTIDRHAPELKQGEWLVVMLNDPAHLDVPAMQKPYVEANRDGEFAFSTYTKGDGIKAGKYIVTFAVLKKKGKVGLIGPDRLNNLYNDPDTNGKILEFNVDHQAPGKSNYAFNLDIAGKETATPGPHALTGVVDKDVPGSKRHAK
jgi:hypothetical protein